MPKIEAWQLKQRQSLSLEIKERFTESRIRQWYEYWSGNVYVSFSGGKDSTALLYLVRKLYSKIPAVFVDTGLEYPEIREFVKSIENVIWVKPKMSFLKIIEKYGYPVISKEVSQKIYEARTTKSKKLFNKRIYGADNKYKSGRIPLKWQFLIKEIDFKISHRCCHYLKIEPIKRYEKESQKHSFVGLMAADSHARRQKYLKQGCNSFSGKQQSMPMAFWLEADVWHFIEKYKIPYSKIYDMGEKRTGCMFCMFGCHLEKRQGKFQRMKKNHPQQYKFCIEKLGLGKIADCIGVKY